MAHTPSAARIRASTGKPARDLRCAGGLAIRPHSVAAVKAGDGGKDGVRARGDHDVVRLVDLIADAHSPGPVEAGVAPQHGDVLVLEPPGLGAVLVVRD